MVKIYKPIYVEIDNEETDGGFFSLGFTFDFGDNTAPHNIGICRDRMENPDVIYIEPDDQIYGFNTKKANYYIDGLVLTITLLDENTFYWDASKSISIALDENNIDSVTACLKSIVDGLYSSDFKMHDSVRSTTKRSRKID